MASIFRRLLLAALCGGLVAGVVAAAAHQIVTVPLILAAEAYEQAAPPVPAAAGAHEHAAAPAGREPEGAWAPENGVERAAFTLVADLLAGIGFALLLAAGLALRGGDAGWRAGLIWGLAGFVVFTLAPGLGLAPELPGSVAAPLPARQIWWLATAALTAGGLALLAFTTRPIYAALAAGLLVLPHLLGAPQPPEHAAAAPAALAARFVEMVAVASLLFWAALGSATGYFYRRFAPPDG